MLTDVLAAAVEMYETGDTVTSITTATGLPENLVAVAVRRAGLTYHPDPAPERADTLDALWLARRRDAVIAAARERVARAEQDLDNARLCLHTAETNHLAGRA